MKALRFTEFGPPSVLAIDDVPTPTPGAGEALVRVCAAAINPSDVANVAGRFDRTTLPRTPGRDFAGVVVDGEKYQGEEVWAIGVDSLKLAPRDVAAITDELRRGFETGALSPPPAIETVPFADAILAYTRVASGAHGAKQVLMIASR